MEHEELIKKLSDLVQLNIDVIHVYETVIERVEENLIRQRLEEFKQNHQTHVMNLSEVIQGFKEVPPDYSRDIKGLVLEGFAAIRSFIDTKGALKALKAVEKITNRRYFEMVSEDIPPVVKELLRKHFSDEKSHLEYIELNLSAIS